MGDGLDPIVGQDAAVAMLRAAIENTVPAYLLVGPAGAGLRSAAMAFAGELLASANAQDDNEVDRLRRLARSEEHPDLVIIERDGAFISADQARRAVRAASTTPVEGNRKIVMLIDLHLVRDAGPMLLKTIEEPSPSTVFVLLAEEVPPELVTIASRCVRIDFANIPAAAIVDQLVSEGVEAQRAEFAAQAAAGSIERARLLASDVAAAERWAMWRGLPQRLDGSGHAVAAAVDELLGAIELAAGPLEEVHTRELAELDERAERFGERGLGRSRVNDRHKRELRRLRVDELRMGLAALGGAVRDELAGGERTPRSSIAALDAIGEAGKALMRNPNERLLLQRTLLRLEPAN